MFRVSVNINQMVDRRRTVVCEDWEQEVDLASHPCGVPGRGALGGTSSATLELSQIRRDIFERIYEDSIW